MGGAFRADAAAGALADSALTAARRLHFDRHYFNFHALRTTSLLALERGDLAAAAEPVERALEMVGSARPAFNYLAQLDRARIWAAGGSLDQALASLPAARSALKSDHSVLLAGADEFEARVRLGLGDQKGARSVTEQLPDDRHMVMLAIIALAAGNPEEAAKALSDAPPRGPRSGPMWNCGCCARTSPSASPHPRRRTWSGRLSPQRSGTVSSRPFWTQLHGWSST